MLDNNTISKIYSDLGQELTQDKLNFIQNNYSDVESLKNDLSLKYGKSTETTPEKKNSDVTSVSTSEVPQSESQQPPKKANSLSVGEKPKKTGASASSTGVGKKVGGKEVKKESNSEDLISKFGIKPGEKVQGVEKKAYEAQRNIPKVGTTKSKPVVSTKPVSDTLTKQVEEKYDTLSKVPAVTEKLEKGVKLSPDELLTISKQQDLVINQNYDPSISQKKLDDELNEYQFLDGISEGVRKSTNKFLLQPLTKLNEFLGGDKDFTIKKGIPLANEMEEAEKELIAEKGLGNFSKEDVSEKAKSIFLKNDEMSQKKNATDTYFSNLPEGHSVQRELEIKKKSDVFKLNEDVKKTVQLKQLNDDRILAYNQFLLDIDKKGFATEEDKIKGQELFNLAKKAEEDNAFLRKEYLSNMSKLQKDEEKLELLKYNYNDLDKTREILNNFFKETIGGGLKLLGETREFVFEQTLGRITDSQYEDPLSMAGDYVIDIGKEWKKGKPEFRMMTLDDVNNWSDAGSWLGQTATEQTGVAAALAIGGPIGLEVISAGSGGAKIKQMEESAKDYSQLQKVLSGWAYYGAEKYTEKYSTFKYIEDLKGSLNTISRESRNLAEKEFKKEVGKVFAGTLAQTQIGAGSEALSSLSNSISDIFINGDKMSSNDIAKNMKEAYAAGLVMDGGISSFGALSTFASRQLRAISDNKDIKDVREIIDRVESINKELNTNLLLTDSDKKILQDKANALSEKAVKIVAKSVDNVGKLSEKEITELLDINKEQSDLKSKLNELNKSAMSSDLKKDQYNDLNSRFIALEEKRNDILKGTYNEFNYLPEEEQTKFKTQAAEAIIQEELDKGIEREKIQEPNAEVINKKAIEIYESSKQTTGQVSEQEKPATTTEAETVSTTQASTETKPQEEVIPKTQEDAIQEPTEQGEEKVKLQEEIKKASDRLSKAYDAYKNIGIVFDPEGNWKKDKELVSSLVDFAVSNIKFGTYNVKNLIEDLAKKGIEITAENAKFVMDKANKAFKRGIEKSVGVKPRPTEQKRINKAFDIGIATEKKYNKEKVEVKKEKESSKKQINKAKSDISKAKANLKKAKIGKLSKDGSKETIMQNKVLNMLFFDPKIVKESVSEEVFNQYLSALDALSKRDIVLKNTPIDEINELYDKIKPFYNEAIESKEEKDNSEGLIEEDAFEKEENKKEAIKAERESIKSKLPSVKSIFKTTDVDKSSYEFKILEAFSRLDDSDINLINEKKLKNVNRILRSLVEDGILVGKAGDLYSEVLAIKTFLSAKEAVGASFKEGVYKGRLGKVLFNVKGIYEFQSVLFQKVFNIIKGRKSEPIRISIIKKRMLSGTADNIDRAFGIYSKDPFYKAAMSTLGKGLSYVYSEEADVNDIMTDVVRSVYSYKKPFEVQLRILYQAIQNMAQSNPETTSSRDAIEYLKSSVLDEKSPYSDNPDTLEKLEKFISDIENKVGFVENEKGELEFELTQEEKNILNNITNVLDNQSERVYEMMIYQNQNAFPMIENYYPVPFVSKQSTQTDIEKLKSRMTTPSTKSARLLEKKGNAHPIGLNPFQTIYSAVKQNSLQFHLRNELIGILDGLSMFREEAVKNKDIDAQVYAETAKNVIESIVDLIINKTVYENDTMYSLFLDNAERLAYHKMLGSAVSRGVDFALNEVLAVSTGYSPAKNSAFYDKVNEIINEVDEDGVPLYDENRKPILLRRLFKNLEASNINKMVSDKFSSSGRREFVTRGVDKSLIKTDLPSKGDVLAFKFKEKMSPITALNTNIVEFSDLKPYAHAWLSYFLNEFKNVSGKELDVELAFNGDTAYLRDNNDFIKQASTFANKQASDLFSSNNPFESSTAVQVSRKGKDLKNAMANMIKGSLYFLTGFEMRSAAAMTSSINKLIEERTKEEFIKLTTNSARFIAYGAAQQGVVSLLSMLFKSDDEDEEKIKDGFSELWDDEEFVLKSFEYVNFLENNKDLIEGKDEIPQEILDKLEEYRKFFRGNKKFVEIMDSYRAFLVRDSFDAEIVSMIRELNSGNERFYIGLTDEWFKMIEDGKVSPDDLMKTYATVFSDYGFKGEEDRMKWQDLIEETLAKNKDYIYKATLDQSNRNIDDAILDNAMTLFSKYRNESFSDKLLENSMVTVLNTMLTTRSNRLVKGGYNYLYEQLNKAKIESERGDGGYDYYKDNVFRPITSYGLLKDNKNWKASSELLSIINPALQGISRASLKNQPLEVLTFSKTLGTIGGNDLVKIKNKLSRDEVYKETAGKFQKNTLLDFSLRKVIETDQQKKDRLLKESFPKTKIIPKGSGKTRIAAKSSDRFGSNTNKKVGGRELRGE